MRDDIPRLAEALWRATTYVCVAQLHLKANPLLTEQLTAGHVKERPSGHWGTVPGTALVLSHLAMARGRVDGDLVPILGAGHAGVVQVATAWLTGALAAVRPQFSRDVEGLTRLVASFPDLDGLGAEVSPLLPGGWYLGGQLGGALAFAQGAALDAPGRIVVPVLGDGECETPATSAAWLAAKAIGGRAAVLPIVHLNGFRMGGRSLLGAMGDEELRAYAAGFGWRSVVVRINVADIGEQQSFHETLASAAQAVGNNKPTVIFLRCAKGWGGPDTVDGRAIIGTPRTHKTPLTRPHDDPAQLAALHRWLTSYGPDQLFTASGAASGALAEAVHIMRDPLRPRAASVTSLTPRPDKVGHATFADAVDGMLRRHASRGDLLLLSPDELISNRLGHLAHEPWAVEVLAEEVLLGWLAGWTSTGRRALLVSYEAFAPLLTTGLIQLLKQRRLLPEEEKPPSVNLLLTSYGWHNTYTHGDPSLATTLLASGDPAVRVVTPADPTRLAVALDDALGSTGRCNIIVAGKHTTACHPMDTLEQERRRGIAVWPHASDEGEPDLVLVAAGDLPAEIVCAAAPVIRQRLRLRVRVVAIHDLTVLGHPAVWPSALSDAEIRQYFGATAPVIIASLGHPAAVWGLIEDRLRRPVKIIGWVEPSGPVPQRRLAERSGMDIHGLCAAAARLLTAHDMPWGTSLGRFAEHRSHAVPPGPADRWPLNGIGA